MTDNELDLMDGLRALAASEPQAASPVVEQKLLAMFRARNARRKRVIWGSVAGAVAAAAVVVALLVRVPAPKQAKIQDAIVQSVPADSAAPQARFAVVRADDVTYSFYQLPDAADLPPVETAMVVRVEMPALSLQQMGVPLGDNLGADPVEADVLMGQDGLARGVRLIQ
jgi:hypothetical protein